MTLIRMDGEYQARDGSPRRVLCVDAPGCYPVIAIDDRGHLYKHVADGGWLGDSTDVNDLIPVPKKHTNIYYAAHFRGKQGQATMTCYWSRESAVDCNRHKEYLIAITGPHEIEFTEGEGLKGDEDAT